MLVQEFILRIFSKKPDVYAHIPAFEEIIHPEPLKFDEYFDLLIVLHILNRVFSKIQQQLPFKQLHCPKQYQLSQKKKIPISKDIQANKEIKIKIPVSQTSG